MSKVAKVIELVGESPDSWRDAIENAISEAGETIDNITGVEVTNLTAGVVNGRLNEYKATVRVAFGVRDDRRDDF